MEFITLQLCIAALFYSLKKIFRHVRPMCLKTNPGRYLFENIWQDSRVYFAKFTLVCESSVCVCERERERGREGGQEGIEREPLSLLLSLNTVHKFISVNTKFFHPIPCELPTSFPELRPFSRFLVQDSKKNQPLDSRRLL